ncbi:MAG: hypothetical protein PHQ98_03460 [Candidatus ainarchaeum sp.]|nr:hypothetical protein [Candidatus ainarchaeum sp.]
MNWVNYVKNHPGKLYFQRIGRGKMYNASCPENTFVSWMREAQKVNGINTNLFHVTVENIIVC